MRKIGLVMVLAAFVGMVSCDKEEFMYEDGTYRAEQDAFSHSWKEYLVVTISEDEITAVEFDALNEADGSLKSELTEYGIGDPPGLPSVWFPTLEAQVMAVDITNYTEGEMDGVSGATHTSDDVAALLDLILAAAKEGDTSTQLLPVE